MLIIFSYIHASGVAESQSKYLISVIQAGDRSAFSDYNPELISQVLEADVCVVHGYHRELLSGYPSVYVLQCDGREFYAFAGKRIYLFQNE